MSDPNISHTALRVLRLLLHVGPTTANSIADQVHRHHRTVRDALQRLSNHGLAMIVGTAPRQPGSPAPVPYLWDVGPAIRQWQSRPTILAQARSTEAPNPSQGPQRDRDSRDSSRRGKGGV